MTEIEVYRQIAHGLWKPQYDPQPELTAAIHKHIQHVHNACQETCAEGFPLLTIAHMDAIAEKLWFLTRADQRKACEAFGKWMDTLEE